jgi:hypothetical protein
VKNNYCRGLTKGFYHCAVAFGFDLDRIQLKANIFNSISSNEKEADAGTVSVWIGQLAIYQQNMP